MSLLSPPNGPKDLNSDAMYRVLKMYIIRVINHNLDTSKNIQEVAITCSYNLNRNGIKTIKMKER